MTCACAILIAAAAAAVQPQIPSHVLDTVAQRQLVDETTQADEVVFRKDVNDRMTVPVHLSGSGPFRFLVDTGADRTAISRDVAARLKLLPGATASMHTMTGVSNVETANVPSLQLSNGNISIDDAPLLEAAQMGADGILGTDSLRSQRVIFDFEKKLMTLVPSKQKVIAKDEGSVIVTGRLRNGRLIVTNAVADDNDITVVIDTGSEISVGNQALRRRLGNSGLLKRAGPIELESVTGEMLAGEYTFVKRLELGQVRMSNLAVVFANAHTFKRLGLENRPALLLGMNAFRAFKKVSIDFANKKLRVMLPEHGSVDPVLMAAR